MFEAQRQHPAAALANAFDIVRANFITILLLIFVGSGGEQGTVTLYWIFGTFVALLVWGVLSWLRFRFSVKDGELKIEQGVFIHKKLYLSSERIQVIDISAGVVQQLFGLVAVEVKTAGSTSKEAKINAISREKAEQLKRLLRKDTEPALEEEGESESEETPNKVYTLNSRDLLLAASTSGRMGVALSIVGAIFSQIDQIIADQQMIRFMKTHMPQSTSTSLILMSIAAVIVVAWIFSFVSTMIKYYDFSVEVRDNDLLISRGLFERRQLTIPFNRIQAVQIKEELLRQPFGFASLVIESAGYGQDEGNSNTLFPLIHKERLYDFINEVIPEYHTDVEKSVGIGKTGLRRYLLRMVWLSLIIIVLSWSFIPYGVYSWFVLLPLLFLGYQQYRDAGIRAGKDTLILSSRVLSKTTAIIKEYRVQATQIKQNPFQARLDLANFTIHVASGNQGRSFTVRELTADQAFEYRNWFRNGAPKEAEASDEACEEQPESSGDENS